MQRATGGLIQTQAVSPHSSKRCSIESVQLTTTAIPTMLIPTDTDQQQMHRAVVIQRLIAQQQQLMRDGQERSYSLADLAITSVANAIHRKGLS